MGLREAVHQEAACDGCGQVLRSAVGEVLCVPQGVTMDRGVIANAGHWVTPEGRFYCLWCWHWDENGRPAPVA